jgi:HK97 family phage prohead protease
MEYKAVPILEQNVGDDRVVKSLFAVMGHVDSGGDRLHKGAFAKTLQERVSRVKVLWQHSAGDPPIGVPVSIREIGKGELPKALKDAFPDATGALLGEVRYLETPRGDEVLTGIKSGAITENSIGYDPVKVDFETDAETKAPVRNLRECKLWDLSPVNWGMQESTMNLKAAIPFAHHPLADEGAAWDGPAQVAAADVAQLKAMCAWYDAGNADVKSAYKLPHHTAEGCQTVWRGVAAAMGALLGSRGGTNIPDGDRKGVYNHLSRHYEEFQKTPPDFKTVELALLLQQVEPEQYKVGRVLSAANIEQLKAAIDTLQKLLQAAEPPTDEVGKALTAQAVRSTLLRLQFAERAIL